MRTIRRHEAIGWTAGVLSVIGTVVLALAPKPDVVGAVWLFWTASQALWIWYARETDSRPLLWAQILYLTIDGVGLARWWTG